jgi:putative endonuclease
MFNWLGKRTQGLGVVGEQLAQQEYKKQGFRIVGQNVFNRKGKQVGEIDFIATRGQELVFVEVKTRTPKSNAFGGGLEAVNIYKQQKIVKAAKHFLANNSEFQKYNPRIDVCIIEIDEIDKPTKRVIILSNAVEDSN